MSSTFLEVISPGSLYVVVSVEMAPIRRVACAEEFEIRIWFSERVLPGNKTLATVPNSSKKLFAGALFVAPRRTSNPISQLGKTFDSPWRSGYS